MVLAIAALALGDGAAGVDPRDRRGRRRGGGGGRRARRDVARPQLARRRARDLRAPAYIAAGALAAVLAGPYVVLVLLAAGALELACAGARASRCMPGRSCSPPRRRRCPALAWTAFKVGALSYGGGFVIIPLMQEDAVDRHGWMTDTEFLNAVAFGQLTPGPVTHTVALVGWAAAGLGGALLAAAIAFAPSFLAILLGGERFGRLRENRPARAFLDGAGPAAVGAILGAAVPLATGARGVVAGRASWRRGRAARARPRAAAGRSAAARSPGSRSPLAGGPLP